MMRKRPAPQVVTALDAIVPRRNHEVFAEACLTQIVSGHEQRLDARNLLRLLLTPHRIALKQSHEFSVAMPDLSAAIYHVR